MAANAPARLPFHPLASSRCVALILPLLLALSTQSVPGQEVEQAKRLEGQATQAFQSAFKTKDPASREDRLLDAIRLWTEAHDLYAKLGAPCARAAVMCRRNAAIAQWKKGRPDMALALLKQADVQTRDLSSGTTTNEIIAQIALDTGCILRELGRYEAAQHACEKARKLFETLCGSADGTSRQSARRSRNLVKARITLSLVLIDLAEYEAAWGELLCARKDADRFKYGPGKADTFQNLGLIALILGNREPAERYLRLARVGHEKYENVRMRGIDLRYEALLAMAEGKDEQAMGLLDAALQCATSAGDKRQEASARLYRGMVGARVGKTAAARADLAEAADQYKAIGDDRGLGIVYLALGGLNLASRQRKDWPYDALHDFEEALAIHQRIGSPEGMLRALRGIGLCHEVLGDWSEAWTCFHAGIELSEALRADLGMGDFRMRFLAGRASVYDDAIRALFRLKEPDLAFAIAEKRKARVLLDLLAESHVELDGRENTRVQGMEAKLNAAMAEALNRLAAAEKTSRKDLSRGAQLGKEIAGITERITEVKAQIRELNPRLADIECLKPISVKDLATSPLLCDGLVLLQYVLTHREGYLWVVTKAGMQAHILPVRRAEIDHLVEEAINGLRRPDSDPALVQGNLQRLDDLLLGPVTPMLSKARGLLIIPDGVLNRLPFDVIRDKLPPVTYAPSATVLSHLRQATAGGKSSTDIVIFADPTRGEGTAPLQFSRAEAEGIRKQFAPGRVRLFVGDQCTRTNVLALSPLTCRYLHISSHGEYAARRALPGGISIPGGSCLWLSDAPLTTNDIFHMKLNVDLVTLSACSTGRGEQVRGEGIVGLTRAFMYAGASAVVVSLWNVDDESTALLMQRFYQNLLMSKSKAAALHDAKQWLKSHAMTVRDPVESVRQNRIVTKQMTPYAHPYYWAPFVLIGAPR